MAGEIFRMTSWTDVRPEKMRITYKTNDRKVVAVFLMLGHEPTFRDGMLDPEKALNALGYFKKKERKKENDKPSDTNQPPEATR